MGLMNKLKNILFEEEEVEIPVLEKKDKKGKKENIDNKEDFTYKEMPKKETRNEVFGNDSFYDDLEPTINKEKSWEEERKEIKKEDSPKEIIERETFKSEKTFNFPAFDEEEFEHFTPKHRPNNILEKERVEKREVKEETKVVIEEKKFRPSPIISPVYGILDKNYTPDEITSRQTSEISRKLDVDSVRKKAFGSYKEETITKKVRDLEEKTEEDKIFEEKMEKARTIDELLKDSSDEVISLEDDDNIDEVINEELEETNNDKIEEPNIATDNEEELEDLKTDHKESDDDTLESDLFDLIDSMYENREDGE